MCSYGWTGWTGWAADAACGHGQDQLKLRQSNRCGEPFMPLGSVVLGVSVGKVSSFQDKLFPSAERMRGC